MAQYHKANRTFQGGSVKSFYAFKDRLNYTSTNEDATSTCDATGVCHLYMHNGVEITDLNNPLEGLGGETVLLDANGLSKPPNEYGKDWLGVIVCWRDVPGAHPCALDAYAERPIMPGQVRRWGGLYEIPTNTLLWDKLWR
jgi:hypothetical protein